MSARDSDNPRTAAFRNIEFDDAAVYGTAYTLDNDGDFVRDLHGGFYEVEGAEMVAQELVMTLRTPLGDDPFRPEFGLDEFMLAGTNDAEARRALIEAIGPAADPRVQSVDDIRIDRPPGNREETEVLMQLTLDDENNTPLTFRVQFEDLVSNEGVRNRDSQSKRRAQQRQEREARRYERRQSQSSEEMAPATLADHQEAERHGFGYEFGQDFGE